MKIICIQKNYSKLRTPKSEPIIFYLKPETSLLLNNRPFYYPDYTKDIVCNVELVLRINKVGKYINEKFASTYYDEIGLAINFTALDLQKDCIKNKQPWELSSSFDNSAPLSKFINKSTFADIDNLKYLLKINDKTVRKHDTSNLLFSFDKIVSHVSQYITLKTGDLIFTGARTKLIPVKISDQLEAFIEDQCLLKCRIK